MIATAKGNITNDYFEIQSSRNADIKIPVGVTMPALEEGQKCPTAVLVHGFLGSKDEEFGFYANNTDEVYDYPSIADELAARGIASIRIDQPGMGDSEDSYLNYTLANSISDLEDAYRYCFENYALDAEKVGLAGWSMGGKVGPKFAADHPEIKTMVLINPAGDNGNTSLLTAADCGLDWENLEKELKDGVVFSKEATEFAGEDVYLSEEFFKQVNESKTGDEVIAFVKGEGNHAIMIYGDSDSIINPDTYKWMIANTGIEYVCVPGMDHDLGLETERPDFTNIVVDVTVSYLVNYLNY